jgi:hypothetical protein
VLYRPLFGKKVCGLIQLQILKLPEQLSMIVNVCNETQDEIQMTRLAIYSNRFTIELV